MRERKQPQRSPFTLAIPNTLKHITHQHITRRPIVSRQATEHLQDRPSKPNTLSSSKSTGNGDRAIAML